MSQINVHGLNVLALASIIVLTACTMVPTAPTPPSRPVTTPPAAGRTNDGGNDHWYLAVLLPEGISWSDADTQAKSKGGYLVTVTSTAENTFVFELVRDSSFWSIGNNGVYLGPWMGGFQQADSSYPPDGWNWVTNELFNYSNWDSGEPNDFLGNQEDALGFIGATGPDARWNDYPNNPPSVSFIPVKGYIIEFE